MTRDQQNTISRVYRNFAESDSKGAKWTDMDEQMSILEWLDDRQLIIESAVLNQLQRKGQPRCDQVHPISECFVPTILEAVGYILDLYSETGNLHVKNRFILQYYLALSQIGLILS